MAKYRKFASKNVKSTCTGERRARAEERVRPKGKEPQTGDRYRTQRSAGEGREGTAQVLGHPKAHSQETIGEEPAERKCAETGEGVWTLLIL
jgi:hypothetical protein